MKIPKTNGISGDRDALVYLLECCGIGDVQALADELLGRYGSFDEVVDRFDMLGLSDSATAFAACIAAAGRYREQHLRRGGTVIGDTEVAGKLLLAWYYGCTSEQLVMLCLDENYRLIELKPVAEGSEISVRFDSKELLRAVPPWDTKYILIAHNHPATPALPSWQDVKSTGLLLRLIRTAGYELLDHIVVCGDDYVSMRESGLLDDNTRFDAELSVKHGKLDYTTI